MARLKVLNMEGKASRELDLPDEVFGSPLNSHLIHEAVVAYQAAGRAGTHATKNRSDVRGGGQKPWKQKKTGRSRHGSSRSPLWRGGGTVFGPTPRDYGYQFPRKKRQKALRSALSEKLREGKLIVLESLSLPEPKTKELTAALKKLNLDDVLIVTEEVDSNLFLSSRNIPGVEVVDLQAINPVSLLRREKVRLV